MLVRGDDDGKSENNNNREQETSAVTRIFQTIKRSEDVTDPAKSKVVFRTCSILIAFLFICHPNKEEKIAM